MTDTPPIIVTADKPARFRKAIVFCSDSNYLPYAAYAADQILRWTPNRDFDLCFCFGTQKVVLPESLSHLDARLCHVDVGNSFEGLRLDPGKSHDVYLRIALPAAFREDYDRILYLDGDIFVQGGDFSRLLDVDIAPRCVAAVRDNVQWRTPDRQNRRNTMKGVQPSAYFNAGVMLMDVKAYLEQDLMARCIAFGRAHSAELKRHDQNLYNAVLSGDWAELSPMWNWQFSWAARFFATLYSPNIVHFIGPAKPWKDPLGEFEPRFANGMRRFMETHFPEMTFDKVARGQLAPGSPRVTKMLWKHILSQRKMARYLERFPDALTVQR